MYQTDFRLIVLILPTPYLLSGVVDSAEYEYLRSSNVVSSGSRVELTEACKWELTAVRKQRRFHHPAHPF